MPRILVIDDQEPILSLLDEALTRFGYEVKTASGGPEGLRLFLQGHFDLVLTDLIMPDMGGIALAGRIRNSDKPHIPVVAMSGTPWLCEASLFDAILPKPFGLTDLVDTIEKVMCKPGVSRERPTLDHAINA
jgi:CheY-like chemotaxis protein